MSEQDKIDWPEFVADVCKCWNEGQSDHDITERYANRRMQWTGRVKRVRIGFDDSYDVTMQMPEIQISLQNGRNGFADQVVLRCPPNHAKAWADVQPGMLIRFETEIAASEGPFASLGVEWAIGDYLSLETRDSILLEILDGGF